MDAVYILLGNNADTQRLQSMAIKVYVVISRDLSAHQRYFI